MNVRRKIKHDVRVWEAEGQLPAMARDVAFVHDLPAGREAIALGVADRIRTLRNADQVPLICGARDPAAALRDWWIVELRRANYLPAKWLPSWWIMAQWLLPMLLDLARLFLEYINEPEQS